MTGEQSDFSPADRYGETQRPSAEDGGHVQPPTATSVLFDPVAPFYDAWFDSPLGSMCFQWERDAILAAASPRAGDRVLDVGCGTGIFTAEVVRAGATVAGVDVSEGMLSLARKRMAREGLAVDLRLGPAERLPFADASFDLALTVTMLEFVASPAAVVEEMIRVVKPGGRLVAAVLSSQSLWALQRRISRQETIYSSAHFFSPGELVDLLRPYGQVSWRGCVMVPPWYWPLVGGIYPALEAIGQMLWRRYGAFLVAKVVKE